MLRKFAYLFLALSIFTIGCRQPSQYTAVEAKHQEVMVIHDEIMPEMGRLRKLRKSVQQHSHGDTAALQLITNLKKAENFMMDWMAEYKIPKDKPEAAQLKYLDGELIKVNQMKLDFNKAMNDAKNYLDSHEH